jgi:hypothetical protein
MFADIVAFQSLVIMVLVDRGDGRKVTGNNHSSIEYYKQERILLCPWRQLSIVNPLSIRLLNAEVNFRRIFQKSVVSGTNISQCVVWNEMSQTRGM